MDVETMEAGQELNRRIHEEIFKGEPLVIPLYSSEIGPAWRIVEEVRRERAGVDERLFWLFTDCIAFGWRAEILSYDYSGGELRSQDTAATLPLSICRAALKALKAAEGKQDA